MLNPNPFHICLAWLAPAALSRSVERSTRTVSPLAALAPLASSTHGSALASHLQWSGKGGAAAERAEQAAAQVPHTGCLALLSHSQFSKGQNLGEYVLGKETLSQQPWPCCMHPAAASPSPLPPDVGQRAALACRPGKQGGRPAGAFWVHVGTAPGAPRQCAKASGHPVACGTAARTHALFGSRCPPA